MVRLLCLRTQSLLNATVSEVQLLGQLLVQPLDLLFFRINNLSVIDLELFFNCLLLFDHLRLKLFLVLLKVINLLL